MSLTVLSVAYPLAPVGPDAVGGAEQVLSALDRALVAAGHRSIVIACQGSRVSGRLLAVPAETGPLDDSARLRAQARHREAIRLAMARYPVDVVHLHGIDFDTYLPPAGPTLVSLHLPLDWYPPAALRPARDDVWLCPVSRSQAGTAPPGAVLRPPIANGVDVEQFGGTAAKRGFALMLGRICPEKAVHLAIDAAKAAGMPLFIGGQVYPYAAHEAYFREQVAPRLDEQRRFLGPLDLPRKRRFLRAAKCLLVPSLAPETSSLVAMEALSAGTPVIAFRSGALPEIVEHGRTGYLVGDAAEMARAMGIADRLDPNACREAARRRFSIAAMTEAYFDAYRAVAGLGNSHMRSAS
ncbi:MAG TPA: glycosyltransferase family 4 protein [Devosia sp.]|nr:glycosyltransferase family 4 protein [Devosia sp.]